MTNGERIEAMEAVFGARIEGAQVQGEWLVWSSNKSAQTLNKFVARAKADGIPGVWARNGKVGCRAE